MNRDLSTLGEEGDVKDVAKGYARNYLFPRGIALPHSPATIRMFEARKGEIEARKAVKRQDAMGLKERLENLEISVTMPAGANGKLYGAVTSQTVCDELARQGIDVDRKRIELPSTSVKVVGKYKASVRLYESSRAEISITVVGQEIRTESPRAQARPARRRRDDDFGDGAATEAPADADSRAIPDDADVPASEASADGAAAEAGPEA